MKLPNLFIPEKKLDDKVDSFLNNISVDEQGLVIAVEPVEDDYRGKIFVWEPSMGNPKLVKKRKEAVLDFCCVKGRLYDCGPYTKVYNTVSDDELLKEMYCVFSMCIYEGKLAYSNLNDIFLDDEKVMQRLVWVYALEFHNGRLYDAGSDGAIRTTIENGIVAKRDSVVQALCSHNGELYDAGHYNAIYNTLTGERIADRTHITNALCSFRNRLLDGGSSGRVVESFNDEVIFDFNKIFDGCVVTALGTVPSSIVKELISFENT